MGGGGIKYICVQLPEKCDEKSEAYKAGYKTIADITQARIKKVIEKIQKEQEGKINYENPPNLGFRKYRLAPSNFKIWRGDIAENEADLIKQLHLFEAPQYENAQTIALLWELLIKNGVPLHTKIKQILTEDNAAIYYTEDKKLAFVLDTYSPVIQKHILILNPRTLICLDPIFKGRDEDKTNAQLKFEDKGITFKTI